MRAVEKIMASAIFAASVFSWAQPAAAQPADACAQLQAAIDQTAAPPADPAQQQSRAVMNSALRDGHTALQCGSANRTTTASTQLPPGFLTADYQSRCPPSTPPPQPPARGTNVRQFNAAVAEYNTWVGVSSAALSCRRAEHQELSTMRSIAIAALVVHNLETERQVQAASEAFSRGPRRRAR